MAGSRWSVVLASALLAALLPAAAVTGAQAALTDTVSSGSEAQSATSARVHPRLVSAPSTQWAIVASASGLGIGNAGQPAVVTFGTNAIDDDSVFVPFRSGDRKARLRPYSANLSGYSPDIVVTDSFNNGEFTATQDDTVWMILDNWGTEARYAAVNGRTGAVSGPYAGPDVPKRTGNNQSPPTQSGPPRSMFGITVADDTVYIAYEADTYCPNVGGIIAVPAANPALDDSIIPQTVPWRIRQMTSAMSDDTLFAASVNAIVQDSPCSPNQPKQSQIVDPDSGTSQPLSLPWYAYGATAVDDTIFMSENEGNGVGRLSARSTDDSSFVRIAAPVTPKFRSIAGWSDNIPSSDDTLFLTDIANNAVWMVNARTFEVDDSVVTGPATFPSYLSSARQDLVYAAAGDKVWALGPVSGTTPPTTGVKDDSITITLALPELFTQNLALVTDVWLDDSVTPNVALVRAGQTIKAKVPAGTGGPYSVIVGLNGGNRIKVGEFTYNPPTPPNPPAPATPPAMTPMAQVISGVVGTVIPATSSFTLANFTMPVAYSIYPTLPAGLTIDRSTGVVSGTPAAVYPSTRHWITAATPGNSESASSTLQVTVTAAPPPPPIIRAIVLDQGERTKGQGRVHDRITTTGSTTGIDPGTRLTPYIRYTGQAEFTQGKATIVVQADGTFRWTRQIRRDKGVTGYVAYLDAFSNQITWVKLP